MQDATADNSKVIEGMFGAFFGNITQRAFGRAGSDSGQRAFGKMGKQVDGLEAKFKQLDNAVKAPFRSLQASASKVESALAGVNKQLQEQMNKIRRMPKLPEPSRQPKAGLPPSSPQPRAPRGRDPSGRGGGTRFGSRFSPGGGLGGISAFGGLGSVGLLFGGASVARSFGSFDANLATIQAEAGLDKTQRKEVTGQILDIAGSTQFNTDEVSGMLIQMIRDGVKLNDALATVPNVLKLAVAESKDLQTAWNATNTIISGLNLPLSESTRLMDMMSNATSLSKLQLEQIQYIAGQSLSLYSQISGFSEEGFFGISGILGPLFRPERIGTGLKQLSLLLPQAATGQLAGSKNDVFQSWGVNITDAAGNLLDEVSVLKEFEKAFSDMSGEARNVELAKVFGTEAAPVFSALIGKSAQLAENMEAIRKKGTLDEKFEVHAKSLTNQFKLLTSAGDSLLKKFVMILNESGAFGGGIGWVTEKITQLTAFMESNKDGIQAWWGNFQEILGGLFSLVELGVEKFNTFWSGLGEGEKTLLTIGTAIGLFIANPVAGLIAAGGIIIAHWQPIKAFFLTLFNDITWEMFGARDAISESWDAIKGHASDVWNSIKGHFSDTWAWMTKPVKDAVSFIKEHWDTLKEIFKWTPIGIILQAFSPVIDFFSGLAAALKAPLEATFNWIRDQFSWLKNEVIGLLNWLPGVNIGGTAEQTSVLPQIAGLAGESDQMYKFRQMQERDRLRKLEEQDVLQLRTIEETDPGHDRAREQAIKRQRRLRAGTSALGGFEKYEQFIEMMNPPRAKEATKSTESYETRAAKPVTDVSPQPEATKTPEHLRPGRAFNRNFLPNFMTGVNQTMAFLYQQQDDLMRQQMMAGRGTNRASMPYLPSLTGFGDELVKQILAQEDVQLFAQMMAADRERTKPSPQALFGTEKKQLPTVDPFSRFDGREATRVISFPKLDDDQYKDMSAMFRDGFLSLVDVSSAILSEMQTQTRLMGGTPDTLTPAIRPLSDSVVDDMVASRLQMTQEMSQPELKDIAAPHVPVIEPQTDSTLDRLLERLRLSEGGEREHGRVTPTGQRVEVGRSEAGGTTIENVNITINADASQSPREIAQAVLAELDRERRARNF